MSKHTVPVILVASDGTEQCFPSVKLAGQYLGVPGSSVTNACVQNMRIHGYYARYANEFGQGFPQLQKGGAK